MLEEIQHMFLSLASTAGSDVHHMSDDGLQAVRQIETYSQQRPSSVESQALDDPSKFFNKRPKAPQKIMEDEMLYRPQPQQMFIHNPKMNF